MDILQLQKGDQSQAKQNAILWLNEKLGALTDELQLKHIDTFTNSEQLRKKYHKELFERITSLDMQGASINDTISEILITATQIFDKLGGKKLELTNKV